MTDTEIALRDALAAVAEALDVPPGQVRELSDRAVIVRSAVRFMLEPGTDVGRHARILRETIASQ